MRQIIADIRRRLSEALHGQFARESTRSGERIRVSIAPYSRFVRAEGESLRAAEQELREITGALGALRARIDRQAA